MYPIFHTRPRHSAVTLRLYHADRQPAYVHTAYSGNGSERTYRKTDPKRVGDIRRTKDEGTYKINILSLGQKYK